MKRTHLLGICLAAAASLASVGCGRSFTPATPPGFVDLGEHYPDNEYRATTADGAVLGIREFDNDPKGELSFWSRALENRMRETGGYALLEKKSVTSRGGLVGTELDFGHDEGSTPHLYRVVLFVTDKKIFVLEAGGAKAEMDRQASQIDWAIKGFLVK
jgi:hypothetical protein